MGKIELRPYQQDIINQIKITIADGHNHVAVCSPTGSGKTVIFTHLAKLVSDKGNKILILTDRAELLYQAGGAIKKNGLNAFYITAGTKIISNAFNVYVGMSQTIRRRYKSPYWIKFFETLDFLVIDEMHKNEFNYLLESGLFDLKHIAGFTATLKRSGKSRQLALDFTHIINGISVKELIKQGYLVGDDYYRFGAPDLHDVQLDSKTGDYKTGSLFQKYNSPTTYSGAVKNYQEITPGTKAICFCVNIEHCIRTAIAFNEVGISAKFIVSKKSNPKLPDSQDLGKIARYNEHKRVYDLYQANIHLTGERKEIFKDFDNNKFLILINAGIATTGFDQPDIETVIVLRATLSTTLWLQMLGRGSRIFPGKTHFNILDFGNNAERLGNYSEDRLWSLWHEKFEGEGLPPIKTCGVDSMGKPVSNIKGCNRPILASYRICPFCGFKYPDKEVKEVILELTMPTSGTTKAVKTKRIKDMSNQELHDYWKIKGHKTPWLWRQLFYRGGKKSIEQFGKEFNWNPGTINKAIEFMS